MEGIRVLHVDDDRDFAEMTGTFLKRHDEQFQVETTTTAEDGLNLFDAGNYDCVVSDYQLYGMDGIDFLEAVRDRDADLPFILYTGKGSEEVASEAISAGVTDYVQKESGTSQYEVLANRIRNAVERRRTTREAQRSHHRREQILKTVPACVVRIDADGQFVFANERAQDVLGMAPTDVSERTYNDPEWDIRDMDGNPIPDEQLPFRQVRDSGEPVYGRRHSIVWPDGTRKYLQVSGAPLFDDDGAVESTVFALTDITAEIEQSRENALYRSVFERAFDAILIANDEGEYVDVNESATELFGLAEEDLLGRSIVEFAPDDFDFEDAWEQFQESEQERGTFPLVRPDGEERMVEYAATSDVIPGRHLSVLRDVTERRRRQRELENINQQLEAVLEHTTTPMFMKDTEGRYTLVNEGYRSLFGLEDENILGLTDREIHPESMAEEVQRNDRRVLEEGQPLEVEERIVVDGEERLFRSSKVPIYDPKETMDGEQPIAIFGVATDVTDLRDRERELANERDRFERFAGVVSHDLRNPLRVAEGELVLAREECDNEHVATAADAVDRSLALIDDLLALAREGAEAEDVAPVELESVCRECWQNVATVEADLVIELDRTVRADVSRLKQLFENLLGNAVQHGGDEVTVTVGALEDGFYVADDGPGIRAADRDRAFELGFSTTDEGTGFGLNIAREVADEHGWNLRIAESDAGGVRFEITDVAFES